ncbi:hypothetical protein CXU22_04610 [Akkermansia muciniphila]|uniref:Uncharacterized protein n=1 Tax=Akkermansia muciniphila TaxID=239935 RepID=A0A2N8HER3_9BACT|nr:hypothetical protein CXU22_04610 [Akkermansia muciniphila]
MVFNGCPTEEEFVVFHFSEGKIKLWRGRKPQMNEKNVDRIMNFVEAGTEMIKGKIRLNRFLIEKTS